MNRINLAFAALVVAALVSFTPAAHAQAQNCLTVSGQPVAACHFIGAGSSAQFITAAEGADSVAAGLAGGTQCVYHWSANNSGNLIDLRNGLIPLEPANLWIVWVAACSDATGNTNVTDIWLDASVDSTVGVRSFFAQNTAANGGAGAAVQVIPQAAGNVIPFWPDGNADVATLVSAPHVSAAIGTAQTGIANVHVNVALTDIRPEDALFATTRTLSPANATLTGLGWETVKCTAAGFTTKYCIGNSILSSRGTGAKATPVLFSLTGANDPETGLAVRSSATIPVGAAPIVFVYNNNGNAPTITNLITGVKGTGAAGGPYNAAHLFDGSTACTDTNAAFGPGGTGANITLFIREPLSGTMNTTEFNVFRTTGNTSDSQEKGVGGLNQSAGQAQGVYTCTGGGTRNRVIGTGESRDAVKNVANGLGYQFFGFGNMSKYGANAKYTYLTVDGIDPFSDPATGDTILNYSASQIPPNCSSATCTASTWWPNGPSFPTLREGTYGAWSLYRWVIDPSINDPNGAQAVATLAQNNVDVTVSDFVPYCNGSGDGLAVYRSHHKSPLTTSTEDNGAVSACGTSLGGGTEAGGDVGGVIYGPFPVSGTVKYSTTTHKFTRFTGPLFATWAATTSANGNNITVTCAGQTNGPTYQISGSVTTSFLPLPQPTGVANLEVCSYTYGVQTPGVLAKKR